MVSHKTRKGRPKMPQETMLLTIAIPSKFSAMMLRYNKGQQSVVESSLRPIQFRDIDEPDDVLNQVADGLGELVELTPIHTVGCFLLDCVTPA